MPDIIVPLTNKTNWQILKFSKLPANEVEFTDQGLKVKVKKSSSPIIFPLERPTKIYGFKARGKILSGNLKISKKGIQGSKKADDFVFKLGLVQKGKETLSWMRRQVAASWVIKLFSLAPKGTGIKNIRFFNIVQYKEDVGKKRTHPLSDLLVEENVAAIIKESGEFKMQQSFTPPANDPIETLAVWLSVDGDETGSEYQVLIEDISLIQHN